MNLLADSALLIMVFIHVSKSIIMSYKHFNNEQQIFEVDTHFRQISSISFSRRVRWQIGGR